MKASTGGLLLFVVLLLGGDHVSTPSAEADSCSESKKIAFTKVSPAADISGPEGVTSSGLVQLFVGLHRGFGGLFSSSHLPEGVKNGDKLDFTLVTDILLGSTGVLRLVVASLVLAGLVPLIGLVVLCVRCLRPSADEEPETEEQAASRVKWSVCFWVLIASLAFMVLGALLTMGHVAAAMDGVQKQGHYLADTIPGVLHKPINDLSVIAGPNFKEFLSALYQRIDDCSNQAATTAENVLVTDPLLKFASTAAEHLLRINELIEKVERAANSRAVRKVRENIEKASTSLGIALTYCTGPCDSIKQDLEATNSKLDEVRRNSLVQLPPIVKALKERLAKDKLSRHLAQIPTGKKVGKKLRSHAKETKATLHKYADHFSKTVGELNNSVKRSVQEVKKALVSLEHTPDDVATGLGIYATVVTVAAGVITIIETLYVIGNQCFMWNAKTGCCSFKTASWTMTVAVIVFILFFPMLMIVSTVGMTAGMAADRKLCVPAQDLGAAGSLSFVEFVASMLGNKEADQGSAALHEDDTETMTYALRIASRRRREGVASSKPRHSVATSGSHSRQRKRATVTSSKRRHGAKHPPTGQGLARKTSRRVESLEREESRNAPQARRRRRRKPLRHIGGFKPPADLPAALRKEFTATALKGVVERFAQCSSEKLPLVKLLGKELVTNLATVILGKNSPWLGLVDDTAGSPKLKALDDLSSQWSVLNVGKDVQQQLNVFTQFQINVAEFEQLATAADTAKSEFSNLEMARSGAQGSLTNAGPATASLNETIIAMQEVLKQKVAFETQMDTIKQAEQDLEKAGMVEGKSIDTYVRENVAKWDSMYSGLQGSVDKVLAIAEKAKAGLSSDLLQFFEHAKEQIQEHIGDCRPFYVLYISTVDAACDQGVRLLAAYWSSVWWFMMLGIPSLMVALTLTVHFARAAVPAEVAKDSVVQRTIILTTPVLMGAAASPAVNNQVPAGQPGT